MLRKPRVNRANRTKPDPSMISRGTPAVAVATISAAKGLFTFSVPISLNGIPQITVNGALPTSATPVGSNAVLLDYAADVVALQAWIIPYNDPAIRTATGGFAASANGVF